MTFPTRLIHVETRYVLCPSCGACSCHCRPHVPSPPGWDRGSQLRLLQILLLPLSRLGSPSAFQAPQDFSIGLCTWPRKFIAGPPSASPRLSLSPCPSSTRHPVPLPEVELEHRTPWLRCEPPALRLPAAAPGHHLHPAEAPVSSTKLLPKRVHRLSRLAQAVALLPESPPTVPTCRIPPRKLPAGPPAALRPRFSDSVLRSGRSLVGAPPAACWSLSCQTRLPPASRGALGALDCDQEAQSSGGAARTPAPPADPP